MRGLHWAVARALSFVLLFPLAAQRPSESVRYALRIADIDARVAEVTAEFPASGRQQLELFMPVWSPGFYRAQPYAERVHALSATAGGAELAVARPQPNRWRIDCAGAQVVRVAYRLTCDRASVTENEIAKDYAVFCGPATWIGEVGQLARPHAVEVTLPSEWGDVATALAREEGSKVRFVARDYDWLLDSPIVLGNVATTTFDVCGTVHEWSQFGDAGDWDAGSMAQRMQPIAEEICGIFGDAPFSRYVFLAGFRRANGGLEHLDSTLLSVDRRQQPSDPDFLSFVAHEYAHAFNVKRLRPVELGPFDYEKPPVTESLWISEGLTTWIGDLALARTGAIDRAAWLSLVSGNVASLQTAPGRRRQTLADASRNVWGGSMSGVGGDPRTTISYYVKGPVVGFVLEARLREATQGRHGLDELMRRAYARWSGEKGFAASEFEDLASDIAGSDLKPFFDRALRSTDELEYQEALDCFGLEFLPAAEGAPSRSRWQLRVRSDASARQRERLDALLARTPKPR
jgi:predicted metalloprotease with PDZ domain